MAAAAMRLFQRLRHLERDVEQRLRGQPAIPRHGAERAALDVLYDDEGAAVVFADLVDLADERMVERGNLERLAGSGGARYPILPSSS